MSIITRIQRGLNAGAKAFRSAPDFQGASKKIDQMIQAKQLVPLDQPELKEEHNSRLDVRSTTTDMAYFSAFNFLRNFTKRGEGLSPYGTYERDVQMSELWQCEPILAGAVYSMCAKMTALSWSVTGRRKIAKNTAEMFATAAHIDGYSWHGFISPTAQDFYTTDRGVFWETARDSYNRLTDIGHIDALSCNLTGNRDTPMLYRSEILGQSLRFNPRQYVHFSSLPSPRERYFGIGFCAVSRAYRAAHLLIGLHDYDDEKLDNLPPEGIAAISGLTMDEFNDAVTLWLNKRQADKSLTFPQVLWLLGSQPNQEVKVAIESFSQLPESFDRKAVVDQYVSTLALDFGVDAREFWPISSGALGTASESEIQHQKARGKGPGEFISITERELNAELPEDAEFRYDTQDIEEDMNAASVAKMWVDAYWPLYSGIPNPNLPPQQANPFGAQTPPGISGGAPKPAGKPGDKAGQQSNEKAGFRADRVEAKENGASQDKAMEQVLDKDQVMRLLVDKGVLPEYLMSDSRYFVTDSDIHIAKEGSDDDYTCYEFKAGVLREKRLPPIVINSTLAPSKSDLPVAEHMKEWKSVEEALRFLESKEDAIMAAERNIHGSPITEGEVTRGSRVTSKTVKAELERWRNHPVLSKYAPTEEEEKLLVAGMTK